MTVRAAEPDDGERIQEVAEQSIRASYALSPDQIEVLLETEFSPDAVAERIDDDGRLLLVAEADSEVVGFAETDVDSGTLQWVQVAPAQRGNGVGTPLIDRVRTEAFERNEEFTAVVLEEATEGRQFVERFGLNRSETRDVTFGSQEMTAHVYTGSASKEAANEPSVEVPEYTEAEGTRRPVDHDERIPGIDAPFFPVYASDTRDEQYGFFCSSCGSTEVAADDLDRLECPVCGNKHRAEEWDGAYL